MSPILGIDASRYQGEHGMSFQRFDALHDAGVRFGIFRATIGTSADASCATNMARADKRGWVTGTYHFLLPGNPEDQAEAYVRRIGVGLAVLDVEQSGVRWADVKAFVERFRALRPGRPIGCYTSEGAWRKLTRNADGEGLFDYLWQARWTQLGTNESSDLPQVPPRAGFGGWKITPLWQYGAFRVRGYPAIDGDAWYGTLEDLADLGRRPRPPLEERPRYLEGHATMLEAIIAAAARVPAPDGSFAYDRGARDAKEAAMAALQDLRLER